MVDQPHIPYGKQTITEEDIEKVIRVMKGPFITQGPEIKNFEKSLSEQVDSRFATCVSNGTAALHVAALSLGIKKNDIVLTTANSFAATSNSVLYCGAEVEFIDIDPETFNICPKKLREHLKSNSNKNYKAIFTVSFAGHPIAAEELRSIADEYELYLLEDASHSIGAKIGDKYVGSGRYAHLTTFSFHPVKHITCGEGGAITTDDEKLQAKLQMYRTHGITKDPSLLVNESHGGWYYEMQSLGYNYRLPDINAVLVNSQLSRLESNIQRRNEIALKYQTELSQVDGLKTPFIQEGIRHAFHLYVIQTDRRKELYEYLKEHNIFCQVHYIPIYQHPYYRGFFPEISLENTENYYKKCLSLPIFPAMTDNEQSYVISKIKSFYEAKA